MTKPLRMLTGLAVAVVIFCGILTFTPGHLAVHVSPTLSEQAEYPDKPVLILIGFVLVFAAWSIVILVVGNIAERR